MTAMTAFVCDPPHPADTLAEDALRFFRSGNEGGMGKWTYFLGNWDNLIAHKSDYYPREKSILLVADHAEHIADELKHIRALDEVGPGAKKTIQSKTVILVRAMEQRGLRHYTASDSDLMAAKASADIVRQLTRTQTSYRAEDISAGFTLEARLKPKALMILGSTIGNLPGPVQTDGREALRSIFQRAAAALEPEDRFVFDFDKEQREQELMRAYNGSYNAEFCLSFLHLIKQSGIVSGEFDPLVWRHEAIWIPETQQMAHMVWPARAQAFSIDGQMIEIDEGTKFVVNNSYKFTEKQVKEELDQAGLAADILTSGANPFSMAIAKLRR